MGKRIAIYLKDKDYYLLQRLIKQSSIDYNRNVSVSEMIQLLINTTAKNKKQYLAEKMNLHSKKVHYYQDQIAELKKQQEANNDIDNLIIKAQTTGDY